MRDPRLLADLPVELGGRCASFLYVEELCRLICISKRFRDFATYDMRMPRDRLFVTAAAALRGVTVSRTPRRRDMRSLCVDGTEQRLTRLARICPRVNSVYFRMQYRLEQTHEPVRFFVNGSRTEAGVNRACIRLSKLASMPCARHLQTLAIVLEEPRRSRYSDLGVGALYVAAFKCLQTIHITITLSHAQRITKLINAWSAVPKAHVYMFHTFGHRSLTRVFECEGGTTDEMLRTLSTWKRLHALQIELLVEKADLVLQLIKSLPTQLQRLKLLIKCARMTVNQQKSFYQRTVLILESKFPTHLADTMNYPMCARFRVTMSAFKNRPE